MPIAQFPHQPLCSYFKAFTSYRVQRRPRLLMDTKHLGQHIDLTCTLQLRKEEVARSAVD